MKLKQLNYWLLLSFALVLFACSDDTFEPQLTTSLETEKLMYSQEGGMQEFDLESNEVWTVGDVPEWITVKVTDVDVATRSTSYTEGKKKIQIIVAPNPTHEFRNATIELTSTSGKKVSILVEQNKTSKIVGYWILSEGSAGSNNSELAWYDIEKGEIAIKQFEALNGKKLGDTGNDLQLYGSKMYCVVSGPGMGNDNTEGTNYIEVIDPATGKSIKRIPFTDEAGQPAKPRYIVFEGGKGYVSSYSNEVVRLDTAALALDMHAKLTGTFAEELAISGQNIYVCNSGQGEDNKISVVDKTTMKEVKVIETAKNPTGIVAAGQDQLFFNTNYPEYAVYSLNAKDYTISKIEDIQGSTLTCFDGKIFMPYFDWTSYEGAVNMYTISTQKSSKVMLDYKSVGIRMMVEYKMGRVNGSNDLFLTGGGQDVVIFDGITKEIKYALKTKVAYSNSVVPYYK